MEPVLLLRFRFSMRSLLLCCLVLVSSRAAAGPATEGEAYTNVARLRAAAAGAWTPEARDAFEKAARAYLARHGDAPRASQVRLWLGDCLAPGRPREAHRLYHAAGSVAGRQRAERLVLLHEGPPSLEVRTWLGEPPELAPGGSVTLLAFVSLTHPQTSRLLPHLVRLHKEFGDRLEVALVAAVVDDHERQRPRELVRRLRALRLPFPAAVDRQRGGGRPSVSLSRYRGRSLPWIAVIDRYGQVAWAGPARLTRGALTRFERRLAEWTKQPTYGQLVDKAKAGDGDALVALARVRAKPTVGALLELLHAGAPEEIRDGARRALLGLGPAHLAYDAQAPARWKREKNAYAYDLSKDRVVRK